MSRAIPDSPEILVVGGGPAGSTVAGLLARRGRRVLLVDRATFPRAKPCGECLNPGAVAALDRLGLRATVEALDPARLSGWSVGGRWASAEAEFGSGIHGLGLARSRLDAALLEEARRRGVEVLEGVRVESVDSAAEGDCSRPPRPRVRLRLGDEIHELRPRVVVGADGLRSRVARSLGLLADGAPSGGGGRISLTVRVRWDDGGAPGSPRRRGRLRVRDGVTVGLAPVRAAHAGAPGEGNLSVVVEAARHGAHAGADPLGLVQGALLRALPEERLHIVDGPWASGSFRRPVQRCWAPGVVLVGDAAGYFDPFTGQGIYRALRSAELAAPAVDAALADAARSNAFLADYGRRWAEEVTPGRRVQKVVDAVMQRPWLREPALTLLGPRSLASIIRITGDLLPISSLWSLSGVPDPRPPSTHRPA